MLGNGRLEAMCIDSTKRLCHIRGKMRKKVWVNTVRVSVHWKHCISKLCCSMLQLSEACAGICRETSFLLVCVTIKMRRLMSSSSKWKSRLSWS